MSLLINDSLSIFIVSMRSLYKFTLGSLSPSPGKNRLLNRAGDLWNDMLVSNGATGNGGAIP